MNSDVKQLASTDATQSTDRSTQFCRYSHYNSARLKLCRLLMVCVLTLLSSNLVALAIDLNAAGPGGGGWLYAGAIDPINPEVMVIGTDMCGVFRTTDGGDSWVPWNKGLISNRPSALDQISYVQDLIIIRRDGGYAEYYAATLGGIFKTTESGIWDRDTQDTYSYSKVNIPEPAGPPPADQCPDPVAGETINDVSIPFSCLAYNGNGTLYAGAGANRTGYEYFANWFGSGLEHYPGLGDLADTGNIYRFTSPPTFTQHTVWKKNLKWRNLGSNTNT
jgi:hypothetical protein